MKKVIIITSIVLSASVTALCFTKAESQSSKKTEIARVEKIQINNADVAGAGHRMDVSSAD